MWRLISTKAYRVRLPRAARVRTPDVPLSSRSHWTDVEGFHHYCLCTSFAHSFHLVSSCWRSFPSNAVTVKGNADESRAPPPHHSAAKVTATVRLSRYNSCEEVGWRRVVIIKHCRHLECLSSFLLYRIVLLGAHGAQEVGAEPSVAGSNHLLAHLTMLTLSCLFGKMVV